MEGAAGSVSTAGSSATARWRLADDGAATVLDDDGIGGRVAPDRRSSQLRQPVEALLGRMQRERREDALATDADVGVDDVGQRREGGSQCNLAAFDQVDVAAKLPVFQVVEINGGSSDVQLDAKWFQVGVQLQSINNIRQNLFQRIPSAG